MTSLFTVNDEPRPPFTCGFGLLAQFTLTQVNQAPRRSATEVLFTKLCQPSENVLSNRDTFWSVTLQEASSVTPLPNVYRTKYHEMQSQGGSCETPVVKKIQQTFTFFFNALAKIVSYATVSLKHDPTWPGTQQLEARVKKNDKLIMIKSSYIWKVTCKVQVCEGRLITLHS